MTLASHICPKCHAPRIEEAFKRKDGKLAGWCEVCRESYRDRLTRLRDSKKLIKHGIQEMATNLVAQAEGYAGHPLANLLALSHIAGAKRALAIRDGKSWRGKKAWGEYYRAQRELAGRLQEGKHQHGELVTCTPTCPRYQPERDPNSEPVSSKEEEP